MDPPNVLWFVGAIVIAFAVNLLLATFPDSHNSLWLFLGAFAFLLVFIASSLLLLGLLWWIPSGLAAAVAVSLVPGTAIAFLELVTLWPDDPLHAPFSDFSGWAFFVALLSAVAGIIAFARTRFPFLLAVVALAVLLAAQLLMPAFSSPPSGDARATTAVVAGAALVARRLPRHARAAARSILVPRARTVLRRRRARVLASLSSGSHQRGWIPMLVAGVIVCLPPGREACDVGRVRRLRLLRPDRALHGQRSGREQLAVRALPDAARFEHLPRRRLVAPLRAPAGS